MPEWAKPISGIQAAAGVTEPMDPGPPIGSGTSLRSSISCCSASGVTNHIKRSLVSILLADRGAAGYAFHLIEQPMLACCSDGPLPVRAICRIASSSSRFAPAGGGSTLPSSRRPRYCSSSAALKP